MLRLTNLANKYQRRTLRALYAQTQAYPYDATLVSTFDRTDLAFDLGSTAAALIPGAVAKKVVGETVDLAVAADNARSFGLFANFVGGELSDIPSDFAQVGVWRGAGGVFELLAPAFDDTGLSTEAGTEDGAAANEVYLAPSAAGVLVLSQDAAGWAGTIAGDENNTTARLMKMLSANAIIVELLV